LISEDLSKITLHSNLSIPDDRYQICDQPLFLICPANGDFANPDSDFQLQRAIICRSSFMHPNVALTPDQKSSAPVSFGDLHSRHLRSGFRRRLEAFRRATGDLSRELPSCFAVPPLDAVAPVLLTENDYDEPFPYRPVLIVQRFNDMFRDIRRQDLEIRSLTDTFAPKIGDLIQNLQEMAKNLTIIDWRKTPKAPMTDQKDQTWATFTDWLRLHCECSNLQ
jgi:hypothetical protein